MKNNLLLLLSLLFVIFIAACGGTATEPRVKVAFSDVPYRTEKNLRIGYTLSLWEYEKDGLELQRITILDQDTGQELQTIVKEELPRIYKGPLAADKYFTYDPLSRYYLSLQLPIPLAKEPPRNVSHRFLFKRLSDAVETTVEGATFAPRTGESPIVIASPLKGKNMVFLNQSNNGYHFFVLLFTQGQVFRSERYAFDMGELSDDLNGIVKTGSDVTKNDSYFQYGKTIHAVAKGKVLRVRDGQPENSGNAQNLVFNTREDLAGNYLVQDIGGGRFAFYAHFIPGSILVKEGDVVEEGTPLAKLGNSGNSTGPHLHFHIMDGPDIFLSNGLPSVLKKYIKTGEANWINDQPNVLYTPDRYQTFSNAMMETTTVISVE